MYTLHLMLSRLLLSTNVLKWEWLYKAFINTKAPLSFLVNKYKLQAKGFKTSELRKIIQELQDLDYKYKIGLIDLNVGLEAILCAYCS